MKYFTVKGSQGFLLNFLAVSWVATKKWLRNNALQSILQINKIMIFKCWSLGQNVGSIYQLCSIFIYRLPTLFVPYMAGWCK